MRPDGRRPVEQRPVADPRGGRSSSWSDMRRGIRVRLGRRGPAACGAGSGCQCPVVVVEGGSSGQQDDGPSSSRACARQSSLGSMRHIKLIRSRQVVSAQVAPEDSRVLAGAQQHADRADHGLVALASQGCPVAGVDRRAGLGALWPPHRPRPRRSHLAHDPAPLLLRPLSVVFSARTTGSPGAGEGELAIGFGANAIAALGPLLAALLPILRIRGVLLTDAATFATSAVLLARLPGRARVGGQRARTSIRADAGAGLRYLRTEKHQPGNHRRGPRADHPPLAATGAVA